MIVRSASIGRGVTAAAAALALSTGCSRSLAHPPYVGQPTSALVEVSEPPPPGRLEVVPPRPSRSSVWIDGEWDYRHERWAWKAGGWVDPPAGARYSPWVFVRGQDGRLWTAPGTWRDANGAARAAPPTLAAAHVEATQVVDASGAVVATSVAR